MVMKKIHDNIFMIEFLNFSSGVIDCSAIEKIKKDTE